MSSCSRPPGRDPGRRPVPRRGRVSHCRWCCRAVRRLSAADVPPGPWGPSPDLVVGEVVTGGASASDEWIEIHDRGALAADLGGLELVYVTASGGTVTRKASWQQLVLKPGASLLLANASGTFASLADDTWSGGLAVGRRNDRAPGDRWRGGRFAVLGHGLERLGRGPAGAGTTGRFLARATARRRRPERAGHERQPRRHLGAGPAGARCPARRPDHLTRADRRPTPEPTPRRPTPHRAADARTDARTDPRVRPRAHRDARTPEPTPSPRSGRRPSRRPTDPSARRRRPTDRRPTPEPTPTDARPTAHTRADAELPPSSDSRADPVRRPRSRHHDPRRAYTTPGDARHPGRSTSACRASMALGTPSRIEGVLTTPLGLTETGHGAFLQDGTRRHRALSGVRNLAGRAQ